MTRDPNHDAPGGDEHGDVAELLHASLTEPAMSSAARARHLRAVRERAAALPSPAPVRAAGGLGRRLASALTGVGLVAVLGASGAMAAAYDTVPGDSLYPVKTASERIALAAPLPTALTVERRVAFADRRLDEAVQLTARDQNPALTAEAIAAHARLMAHAWELAESHRDLTDRVEAATAAAQRRLARLLARGLPEVAAEQARAALSAADARLDRQPASPPAAPPPAAPRPDGRPGSPQPRPDTPRSEPAPAPPASEPAPAPQDPDPAAPAPESPAPHTPAPGDPGADDQSGQPAPQAAAPSSFRP